jgi:hypothetical protein
MQTLATTYGWDIIFLAFGLPALNWAGAVTLVFVAIRKTSSPWWLLASLVSLGSAGWLARNFILQDSSLSWADDRWQILCFFLPGLVALIAFLFVVHKIWIVRRANR